MKIDLPEEFIKLCEQMGVKPRHVLTQFIADASGINQSGEFHSGGSDERMFCRQYIMRCDYAMDYRRRIRDGYPQKP